MRGPILIVDDYEDWRSSLKDLLVHAGYSVVEAPSGRQALNYLTSDKPPPALVLLDLHMPGMNGWDFLAVLQAYLRLSSIPVIVISGASAAPPAGRIARFFRKPIDNDQLLVAVRQLVDGPGGFNPPPPHSSFGSSPIA
jgi:CheY-like chemotaxis protein